MFQFMLDIKACLICRDSTTGQCQMDVPKSFSQSYFHSPPSVVVLWKKVSKLFSVFFCSKKLRFWSEKVFDEIQKQTYLVMDRFPEIPVHRISRKKFAPKQSRKIQWIYPEKNGRLAEWKIGRIKSEKFEVYTPKFREQFIKNLT